jgi:oligosaccharide 4-alpha-D-glucosyltransferase
MTRSALCLLAFALLTCLKVTAQRTYVGMETHDSGLIVHCNDGRYFFSAYSPQVLEARFEPSDSIYPNSGYQSNPTLTRKSFAVVASKMPYPFAVVQLDSMLWVSSGKFLLIIHKNPFSIDYYYHHSLLLTEKNGYHVSDGMEWQSFTIAKDEILMGGGSRVLGMNRRGHRLPLYNRAHYGYEKQSALMNYTLPVVVSSRKYLLHFDNAPVGILDLDSAQTQTLQYGTVSGSNRYQIIAGDSWEQLTENLTFLTGRQPMPPMWAFGHFASRFGYHSQQEVMDLVRKHRELEVPLDAVVLDLYWYGDSIQGSMGNWEFFLPKFPHPQAMIDSLSEMGIQVVLITQPFILTTSSRWEEAVSLDILAKNPQGEVYTYDFYFGTTGLLDVFKPATHQWLRSQYDRLKKMNIAGFWGDLGEPEVHPSDMIHEIGTAGELHNVYGHEWARIIYEWHRDSFPAERLFLLMRAGASGSQRYGLIPWSGDVNRSWGGLWGQPEIALQMNLQGLAYMHSDLGGFAGDLDDSELYERWLQFGVFQAIFRPHAQEQVPSEVVFKDSLTLQRAKDAITLRYRLFPYLYSMAYENSTKGTPMMKPFFFACPTPDSSDVLISHTFLWGHDFLVHAITEPHVQSVEIPLPPSSLWVDFYQLHTVQNTQKTTQYITCQTHPDRLPTFVRAGSIIPLHEPMNNTLDYHPDKVSFYMYLHPQVKKGGTTWYSDNGRAVESQPLHLHVKYQLKRYTLTIDVNPSMGSIPYQGNQKWYIVHQNARKYKVVVNGKRQPTFFDPVQQLFFVYLPAQR